MCPSALNMLVYGTALRSFYTFLRGETDLECLILTRNNFMNNGVVVERGTESSKCGGGRVPRAARVDGSACDRVCMLLLRTSPTQYYHAIFTARVTLLVALVWVMTNNTQHINIPAWNGRGWLGRGRWWGRGMVGRG